jgi:hypothetical protein
MEKIKKEKMHALVSPWTSRTGVGTVKNSQLSTWLSPAMGFLGAGQLEVAPAIDKREFW